MFRGGHTQRAIAGLAFAAEQWWPESAAIKNYIWKSDEREPAIMMMHGTRRSGLEFFDVGVCSARGENPVIARSELLPANRVRVDCERHFDSVF